MPVSLQRFHDERTARYSKPNNDVVFVRGEPWVMNLQIVCPSCGAVFYGYQSQDRKVADGYCDPEPEIIKPGIADGRRRTCGHPYCEAAEDKHQMDRGTHYNQSCRSFFQSKAEPIAQQSVRPKLSKAGK